MSLDNIGEFAWDGSKKQMVEYFREQAVTTDDIRVKIGYRLELHSKSGKVYYKDRETFLFPKDVDLIGTNTNGFTINADDALNLKK